MAWLLLLAALLWMAGMLACGWYGVLHWRSGRRALGASVLAAPFVLQVVVGFAGLAFSPQIGALRVSLLLEGLPLLKSALLLGVVAAAAVFQAKSARRDHAHS